MFLDDSPEYPMTFAEQYEFSGQIDRTAFEAAYQEALDRHPLLTAIIQPAKANRDCWVASPRRPQIDWGDWEAPITLPQGEFINLREDPGLRVWVRQDDQRAAITLQFHHATVDGIGSYQFLGDVLQGYARRTGGTDVPELVELDPKSLRDRNRSGFEPLMTNDQMEHGYRELWEFMKRRIAPVAPPADPAGRRPPPPFPGIRSYSFDKDAYKQLRLGCQREGLTVNDALVSELLLTLRDWNRQFGRHILPRGLCIMVPMDLRRPDEPLRTACNCVTYALLRRSHRELQDESGMADFVRQEMTRLKTERYFTGFAKLMVMARWNPKMAKLILRSPKCFASAIVSNTGDPTKSFYAALPRVGGRVQCGNLTLESVSGVPPLRKKSRVTISIFTYLRELKICMRCSPHHFSAAGTQQLLDAFVARLQSIASR
ncbi:MAG: chromosome condensation protein [Planctomycetota bacterium]|nr:MAG: chromosome condensation protein [Planctomycetota bacterium]